MNKINQGNHAARCRTLFTAAALALLGACSGCGGGSDAAAGSSSPSTPTTPTTPAGNAAIDLAWTGNTESDLGGYKVYYGKVQGQYEQAKGSGLDAGLSSEYRIAGLQAGVTYYIVVTAYDRSGNESGYSAPISGVAK